MQPQLSNKRVGRFTASRISELIIGVRGGTATRDKYIAQKAVEKHTGIVNRGVKTYAIEHGQFNEYEAIEAFKTVTGLNVVPSMQVFYEYDADSGATPDATIQNFDDVNVATVDAKCPQPDSFFEQKMMLINEGKPEYQNVPKSYYYQAQMQMMSVGVAEHYLVRYLAEYFEDEMGELIKCELPLEQRIYIAVIKRDEAVCKELDSLIKSAANERDMLIEIYKKSILNKIS
jgi:hypothetical protein